MFDELFFTDFVQNKICLYKYLLQQPLGIYRVYDLAQTNKFNFGQATRLFKEIEEDLFQASFIHQPFVQTGGKVEHSNCLPKVDSYRAHLLRNSVPFQYILSIINDGQEEIQHFCERLAISKSTLARLMRPLNKFLQPFSLRFTHHPVNIVGDEFAICQFLVHVSWTGIQGNYWPFIHPVENYNELTKAFHRCIDWTPKTNNPVAANWGVFIHYQRYQQGKRYTPSKQCLHLIKATPGYQQLDFSILPYFDNMDDFQHHMTSWLLISLLRYVRKRNVPVADLLGVDVKRQAHHPMIRLTNALFNLFGQERLLPDDKKTQDALHSELLFEIFKLYCFTTSLVTPDSFLVKLSSIDKKDCQVKQILNEFYENSPKEIVYLGQKVSKKRFVEKFYQFYQAFLQPLETTPKKFTVGIAMDTMNYYSLRLKYELEQMKHVVVEKFNYDCSNQYDLVIHSSNQFSENFPDVPQYFWGISYGQEEYIRLHLHLTEQLLRKRLANQEKGG
ncbi:MAG: helix-turn-helix domain-containing protein [Streptococcaceae bacterium]|jgi:hypothetical protein|nr:helix-turn-helix domain-containing protein [Streptococcaceae bacterium]